MDIDILFLMAPSPTPPNDSNKTMNNKAIKHHNHIVWPQLGENVLDLNINRKKYIHLEAYWTFTRDPC